MENPEVIPNNTAAQRRGQAIGYTVLVIISIITVLPILGLFVYIIVQGYQAISWEFLTAFPKNGMRDGGIMPAIVGTFYLTLGTAIFSIPPGIAGRGSRPSADRALRPCGGFRLGKTAFAAGAWKVELSYAPAETVVRGDVQGHGLRIHEVGVPGHSGLGRKRAPAGPRFPNPWAEGPRHPGTAGRCRRGHPRRRASDQSDASPAGECLLYHQRL